MRLAFALLLALAATPAAAEIYRYVDDDGSVHYTDEPPAEHKDAAETVDLAPIPTVEPPAPVTASAPPGSESKSSQDTGPLYRDVSIVRPFNEQTIRDATHQLPVVVQTTPTLRTDLGHRVRFILDGSPLDGEPVASNTVTMQDVYRGEHTVSAEILDAGGRVIGSASPVTVFMKPPRAR